MSLVLDKYAEIAQQRLTGPDRLARIEAGPKRLPHATAPHVEL